MGSEFGDVHSFPITDVGDLLKLEETLDESSQYREYLVGIPIKL